MSVLKSAVGLVAAANVNICKNAKVKRSMAKHLSVSSPNAVSAAVKLLKSGGVVALPTDTLYGLACDATNQQAIRKLFEVKCRDENKPLAICLGRVSDICKWVSVDRIPESLLDALLPGPVTLLLPCCGNLDKSLTYHGKVGIRIPDYKFVRNVVNELGSPIALTSANKSSEPSSLTINDFNELWDQISGIFDGGKVNTTRSGSTIIDLTKPNYYNILRSGIAESETRHILESFGLNEAPCQYE